MSGSFHFSLGRRAHHLLWSAEWRGLHFALLQLLWFLINWLKSQRKSWNIAIILFAVITVIGPCSERPKASSAASAAVKLSSAAHDDACPHLRSCRSCQLLKQLDALFLHCRLCHLDKIGILESIKQLRRCVRIHCLICCSCSEQRN